MLDAHPVILFSTMMYFELERPIMEMVLTLIFLPAVLAGVLAVAASERLHYLLCAAALAVLGVTSVAVYATGADLSLALPHWLEWGVAGLDVLLLLFFLQQGLRYKSLPAAALAVVQMLLYAYLESRGGGESLLVVDELSRFMFLVINIVGGVIVLYAVRYMRDEATDERRKRFFVAGLMSFLSVMNAIVCADSVLLFFFLFETTTLASYLLIAFRGDALSRANALRALWMNQIGGVVILLGGIAALYGFGTLSLGELSHHSGGVLMLAVSLLAMAALVKGASIPFDGWLLGAMVAPTPVSAMLHSAAMVKIAPYLIMRLSPTLSGTPSGELLSLIGAAVFVAASYLALSRSVFKEILGYSTVALLGLMISLAAIGTPETILLCMALLLFHALAKALLFLAAGVFEKCYHAKELDDMKAMAHRAPQSVGYVLLGFVSLTLPPFGLFMGKLFAIASVAALLQTRPWLLAVLLAIVVGSALLVLLYFKMGAALLSRPSDVTPAMAEHLPYGYGVPMFLLALLSVLAALGFIMIQNDALLLAFMIPLLFVVALPPLVRSMERFDRVDSYGCGEKAPFEAALVYFAPSAGVKHLIYWGFGALFVALAAAGGLS